MLLRAKFSICSISRCKCIRNVARIINMVILIQVSRRSLLYRVSQKDLTHSSCSYRESYCEYLNITLTNHRLTIKFLYICSVNKKKSLLRKSQCICKNSVLIFKFQQETRCIIGCNQTQSVTSVRHRTYKPPARNSTRTCTENFD